AHLLTECCEQRVRKFPTWCKDADARRPTRRLCTRRERPRSRRAAECGQQFPPSDGDCHTLLPCEVRMERIPRPKRSVLPVQVGASTSSSAYSRRQLLANAAIVASRVGSQSCAAGGGRDCGRSPASRSLGAARSMVSASTTVVGTISMRITF